MGDCSICTMADPPQTGTSSTTYWYDDADPAVALLRALRRFRAADHEMRRHMSRDMDLNATDLEALRYVISHELTAESVTAHRLAVHLEISTASTAKLLNRLTASGHLRRVPHPQDRRSVIVTVTDHAHEQIRERSAGLHRRMLETVRDVPEESRQAIVDFLDAMIDSFGSALPAQAPDQGDRDDGGAGAAGTRV